MKLGNLYDFVKRRTLRFAGLPGISGIDQIPPDKRFLDVDFVHVAGGRVIGQNGHVGQISGFQTTALIVSGSLVSKTRIIIEPNLSTYRPQYEEAFSGIARVL